MARQGQEKHLQLKVLATPWQNNMELQATSHQIKMKESLLVQSRIYLLKLNLDPKVSKYKLFLACTRFTTREYLICSISLLQGTTPPVDCKIKHL